MEINITIGLSELIGGLVIGMPLISLINNLNGSYYLISLLYIPPNCNNNTGLPWIDRDGHFSPYAYAYRDSFAFNSECNLGIQMEIKQSGL